MGKNTAVNADKAKVEAAKVEEAKVEAAKVEEAKNSATNSDNGVYRNTIANPLLLGMHRILGGEKFTFTSTVLSNEIVKKRFKRAVELGLLVKA